MRIGIDARMLGERGIGRYIEQLILNLEKQDIENQYFIFLNKNSFDKYEPKAFNFTKVLADYKWYGIAEQFGFPKLLKKYKLDLVHFPHFNVPIFYNKPFVVTIHDLIALKFPTTRATTLGPLKYSLKKFFSKFVISHAISKAKKVITISDFTKNDLVEFFKLNKKQEDKIKVIYEGVTKLDNESQIKIHKSEFIDKNPQFFGYDFIIYIGSAYPHKNLEKLCEAFKDIDDLKLVLVGKEDYFYNRIKENYKDLINNKIFLTGYLDDEELIGLINKAKFYIFPSLYEGFGLPPLEVMQYGLPVLSSYSSCLPEILRDCVEYFDATDKNEIISAINKLKNNPNKLKDLSIKGPLFIKRYQWGDCIKETYKIYTECFKKKKIK